MNPRQLLADRLAADFTSFVRQAWPVLHPTRELIWDWPYDLLCEHLIMVASRKTKRLIVNIPPRCL